MAPLKQAFTAFLAMGAHGSKCVLEDVGHGEVKILTHCNTGSLATCGIEYCHSELSWLKGYGTALGVIRALHEAGELEHVFCTETRPYNQVGTSRFPMLKFL